MHVNTVTADLVRQVVEKKGTILLPSKGQSMFPFIKEDDLCHFESVNPDSLKKGEIVLFATSANNLVAHRFVKRYDGQYLFKGDTNLLFDEPVHGAQIIGRMTGIERNNKRINSRNVGSTLWGFLILNTPLLSRILRRITHRKQNFQY